MPATNDEAMDIIRVMTRYLPLDKVQNLADDLCREVGSRSTNDSLRMTLLMLKEFADEAEPEDVEAPAGGRQSVHTIDPNKGGLVTYARMSQERVVPR